MKFHIVNGALLPAAEASVGVNDLALLRGYGVFDYFSVHRGHPVFLEDHLQRFQRSAAWYELDLPCSEDELRAMIFQLIRACDMQEGGISLILTGGSAEDGFYADTPPNLLLLSRPPAPRFVNKDRAARPVKLLLDEFVRELPEAKGLNYARALRRQKDLQTLGASELLYIDGARVLETYRSNVFLVLPSGKLYTAGRDVLQGITRKYVLQLARESGMEVVEGDVSLRLLAEASELFLTGSGKGLFPVSEIYVPRNLSAHFDASVLSADGDLLRLSFPYAPGPVWSRLNERLNKFIESGLGRSFSEDE